MIEEEPVVNKGKAITLKGWIFLGSLIAILTVVTIGYFMGGLAPSPVPVNGEEPPEVKTETFYLGERIFKVYPLTDLHEHFFFHGFERYDTLGYSLLVIGHLREFGYRAGSSNMFREIRKGGSFQIYREPWGRVFTVVDYGRDWIMLRWEE